MTTDSPLIFLIAGEASGDVLGARLMKSIKARLGGNVRFAGVGGTKMTAEGLKSIFPMEDLSIIGFAEIIPHIPKLLGRIKQTVNAVIEANPAVVVSIDAPAFNRRVGKKLREHLSENGGNFKLVHYVAPSVWAYKPQRAAKMARIFDHLLALLPMEPPYFEKEGLACTFVGHPVVEEGLAGGDGADFRKQLQISAEAPLLSLMPGSRAGELKRHLPVFEGTIALLKRTFPKLQVALITTPKNSVLLKEKTKDWAIVPYIIADEQGRRNALAASTLALVKSGTASLEVSAAGAAQVVMYRVSAISAWMLRRMILIDTVTLVNVLLGKKVIPEFLQEECNPHMIALKVNHMMIHAEERNKQVEQSLKAVAMLKPANGVPPSEAAALAVLKVANLLPTT